MTFLVGTLVKLNPDGVKEAMERSGGHLIGRIGRIGHVESPDMGAGLCAVYWVNFIGSDSCFIPHRLLEEASPLEKLAAL